MNRVLKILCLEDNTDDAMLLEKLLKHFEFKFEMKLVSEKTDFINAISDKYDVIISDHSMHKFNSLDVLHILKEQNIETPLIVISGMQDDVFANKMISEGAFDFINKDNIRDLASSIMKAVKSTKKTMGN